MADFPHRPANQCLIRAKYAAPRIAATCDTQMALRTMTRRPPVQSRQRHSMPMARTHFGAHFRPPVWK